MSHPPDAMGRRSGVRSIRRSAVSSGTASDTDSSSKRTWQTHTSVGDLRPGPDERGDAGETPEGQMGRTREIEIDVLVAHELAIGSPAGELLARRPGRRTVADPPLRGQPDPRRPAALWGRARCCCRSPRRDRESKDLVRHHWSPDSGAAFSSIAPAPASPSTDMARHQSLDRLAEEISALEHQVPD